MDPAEKKPPEDRQPEPAEARRLRLDAAHARVPKSPHYLAGKDRPGDR